MRAPKMRPPVSVVVEWHDCIPATCGLHLPESLSQDRWLAVGKTLCTIETSFSWWWGDWWRAYKPDWGQQKAITKDDGWNGPSYQTLVNLANVCSKFKTNRRRLNLSFKHHAELTAMDPADADAMLDWCEEPTRTGGRPRSVDELRVEKRSRFKTIKLEITTYKIPLYPSDANCQARAFLNKSTSPEAETKRRYGMETWRPSGEIQVDLEWSRRRIADLERENEEAHERLETANRRIAELEAENQNLRRQIGPDDHPPARSTPRLVH
jgi:hypothetical protein